MGMSQSYGDPDRAGGLATIARALELGVTFFDTADIYGRGANEELVGEALRGHREEVVIASKCGLVPESRAWFERTRRERGPHPVGLRGEPPTTRRPLDRPLLPSPGRPSRPDRG